jgi:hypothetical protein
MRNEVYIPMDEESTARFMRIPRFFLLLNRQRQRDVLRP